MRTAILAPDLPPDIGGVGDHAAWAAERLAREGPCWLVTRGAPGPDRIRYGRLDDIPGLLREKRTEALLVEYVPFLYARSGVAPDLVRLLQGIRSCRTVLLVHEPFMPWSAHPARLGRSLLQRMQLWDLCRAASAVAVACEGWRTLISRECTLLPPGSAIPKAALVPGERASIRASLGLREDDRACLFFGSGHPTQRTDWVRQAGLRMIVAGRAPWPHDGAVRCGVLPAAEASRVFQACDLQAAPFVDGISARRTSALAGLEHGLPLVTTSGPWTDPSIPWGEHVLLAKDEREFAERLSEAARDPAPWRARSEALYRAYFDRELLGERLAALMRGG